MGEGRDEELERDAEELLQPGDINLRGVIVYTEHTRSEELAMHEDLLTVGGVIAEHACEADWYVYSGNDNPEFGLNQHQGRTLTDDAFVWECQSLVRNGTFVLVFYYEASTDHSAILTELDDAGFHAIGID